MCTAVDVVDISHIYWWLIRVTLVVAFCHKILGGERDLQMILLLELFCSLNSPDIIGGTSLSPYFLSKN